MDAVQAAHSGHPGTPMALAPLVYTLWNRVMRFDPQDPIWPNRDRFVLSNGHASMLLWSMLHLTGTKAVNADYERLGEPSVTLEDIRSFRQLGSKAPGHPEYRMVSGVETTTGPSGTGRRDERRHGHRRTMARRPLQPTGLRGVRLRHLCDLRRRLPDGGRQRRGCVVRRPPGPGSPLLDLGQQPHHHRRRHRPDVHGGRRGQVPLLWLECAARGRRQRRGAHRTRAAGLSGDQGPAHVHRARQQHRVRLAQPTGHRRCPRRAARGRGDPSTKRVYGWPEEATFLVPDGVPRALRGGHRETRGANAHRAWTQLFGSYRSTYPELATEIDQMQRRSCRQTGIATSPCSRRIRRASRDGRRRARC